jgi:hypothetical protein
VTVSPGTSTTISTPDLTIKVGGDDGPTFNILVGSVAGVCSLVGLALAAFLFWKFCLKGW